MVHAAVGVVQQPVCGEDLFDDEMSHEGTFYVRAHCLLLLVAQACRVCIKVSNALAQPSHQPCSLQYLKVLGDRGCANLEVLGMIAPLS
ncbi:hypothetical protein [Paenibacillus motobuensis]